MASSKNSNHNPKAGAIGFGITALAVSALFGFAPAAIAAGVVLGLGAGWVISVMASGLDTTTHNKQDILRQQQEEAKKIPPTGNEFADSVIARGQELIATVEAENAVIPDPGLSAAMDTLAEQARRILRTVSEEPDKAPQVRKFMSYYMPTANKILSNYRLMVQRGVNAETLNTARETAQKGMDLILTACQKQIDNLHRDHLLDISTDIDVLEQMLKRDGYTGTDIPVTDDVPAVPEARTAAEAQMRQTGAPVLNFKEAGLESDDSASVYFNKGSNS